MLGIPQLTAAIREQSRLTRQSISLQFVEISQRRDIIDRLDKLLERLNKKPPKAPLFSATKTGDSQVTLINVSDYDLAIDPPDVGDDVVSRALAVTADAGALYTVNGEIATGDGSPKSFPIAKDAVSGKVQIQHGKSVVLDLTQTDSEGETSDPTTLVLNSVDNPPAKPGFGATKTGDSQVDDSNP